MDAEAHNQCMYYGLKYGSPEYADCMIKLVHGQQQQSFQRQQALAAGIASLGDYKPVQVQMPAPAAQQRQPVRCQSRRNALGVETNCE